MRHPVSYLYDIYKIMKGPRNSDLTRGCHQRLHYSAKIHQQKIIPLIIFLFPDGNLMTNLKDVDDDFAGSGSRSNNSSLFQRKPLNDKYRIDPSLWHHNELIVADQRIFVLHKIPLIGRVIYAAADLNLDLLWTVEVDLIQGKRSRNRFAMFASTVLCSVHANFHWSIGCAWAWTERA